LEAIGANGQVVPRKAIFVKDKYFVEIAVESQGDRSALLRAVSKELVLCVPGDAAVPEPIGWFLSEGLTAESILGIRARFAQAQPARISEGSASRARAGA
jgi:hypothetical protein